MTGLIILAAGESKRLGQPKQNLVFQNRTLLQCAIDTGLASECGPVIVVLGANAALIEPTIQYKNVIVLHNPDWAEGMASSIRTGITEIEKNGKVNNVIIMLCDQPFVSVELISQMLEKQQKSGRDIVACSYKDTVGVPVLFSKLLFPELLSLQGNEGAKNVLKNHVGDIAIVPFEMGGIDVDTVEDYDRLIGLTE